MHSDDHMTGSSFPRGRLSTTLATLIGGAVLVGTIAVGVLLYWPATAPADGAPPPSMTTAASQRGSADTSSETTESERSAPAATAGEPSATSGPFAVTGDEDETHGWPPMYPEGMPLPTGTIETLAPSSAEDLAAIATAQAFAEAFVRAPSDQEGPWYERIKPFLSPQARLDYVDTDPSTVWFTKVTGAGTLATLPGEEQSHFIQVLVPTDGGLSSVDLMADERYPSGWAVRSFTPPEDLP